MLRQLSLLVFMLPLMGKASAFSCLPYTLNDAINDHRESVAIFDGTILEASRLGDGCRLDNASKGNKHYAKIMLRVDEAVKGSKRGDIFSAEYNAGRYYYDEECNLNTDFTAFGSPDAVDVTKPSGLLGHTDRYFLFETRGGVLRTQPLCFGYDKYEQTIEAAIEADAYVHLSTLAASVPMWIGELGFDEIVAWKIEALEIQKQVLASEGSATDKQILVMRELDMLLSLRDNITPGDASDLDQDGLE